MKLALFDDYRPAVVRSDHIADAAEVAGEIMTLPPLSRMPALIEAFDRLSGQLRDLEVTADTPLSDVQLRAPVPKPSKILCAAANFREGVDAPLRPLNMFLKSPEAICDPDGTVTLPSVDVDVFHHEAELAAIIGERTKDASVDDAMASVFGYACFIDVSARGSGRGIGLTGKSYDTFAPFGPWIVTADEVPDVGALQVRLWVDDVLRQDYSMDDIAHPVPEIVAETSRVCTLVPGDVLACGTNHQQLGPLQHGETVAIEIDRIGRLQVTIDDPLRREWPKQVDEGVARRLREMRKSTRESGINPQGQ